MNFIIWSNFGLMPVRRKKADHGLTIFEILTVTLIITILALIAIPQFIGSKNRAYEASAESNARTLRIMLETYKVDHQVYPENLLTLGVDATSRKYNKEVNNPITNAKGLVESGKWAIDYLGTNGPPGMVTYQPLSGNSKFYIFIYDHTGSLLQHKGQVFSMSNG